MSGMAIEGVKDVLRRAAARATVAALSCGPLLAGAAEVAGKQRVDPVSAEYIVKTAVGLIVVIAIIAGLAWLMRRMGKLGGVMAGQIKIVSSLSLGTREKLLVVKVGEEQFLIGATPSTISRIARLQHPIDIAPAVAPALKPGFQDLLSRFKRG